MAMLPTPDGENQAEDLRQVGGPVNLPHNGDIIRNAPGKLKAFIDKKSSTGTHVTIGWNDSDTSVGRELVGSTEYEVSWDPHEGDSPHRTSKNKMRIALQPGNTYRISVRQINEGKGGTPSNILIFASAPKAPKNIRFHQISDVALQVTFDDPDEKPKRYILHCRNDETEEKNETTDTKSCVLHGLTPGGRYEISVQAQETNGELSFKSVRSWGTFTLRPSPPSNPNCDRCRDGYRLSWENKTGETSFRVEWAYGSEKENIRVEDPVYDFTSDELKPGRCYMIKIYALGPQDEQSRPAVLHYNTVPKAPTHIRVTLDGIFAIVEYQDDSEAENTYHVVAHSIDGKEKVEKTTGLLHTKLRLETDRQYSISVRAVYKGLESPTAKYDDLIRILPVTRIQGLNLMRIAPNRYKATWEKVRGSSKYDVTVHSDDEIIERMETEKEELTIFVPDPTKSYDVDFTTVSKGDKSEPVRITIHEQPAAPENLEITKQLGRYHLSWGRVNAALKYRVERMTGCHIKQTTVSSEECYLTEDDLKPGKSYQINVCALGEWENESESAVLEYDTAPLEPTNISIKHDGSEIHVRFQDDEEANSSYEVVAEPISKEEEPVEVQTKIKTATLSLQPGVEYTVSVYALYKKLKSAAARYQELVRSGPAPIEQLHVRWLEDTSYKVEWTETRGATNYIVTLRCEEDERLKQTFETVKSSRTLHDIDSAKSYIVEVEAANSSGGSSPQRKKILPAPAEVEEIIVIRETEKRCKITWKKVPGAVRYSIILRTDGKELQSFKTASLECYLRDLDEKQSLDIEIRAINGTGESYPRQRAILHIPKNIRMVLLSSGEVEISCEKMPGAKYYCFIVNGGHVSYPIIEKRKQYTAQFEIDNCDDVATVCDPMVKIKLMEDRHELGVQIRAETGDGSYADTNQFTFKNAIKIVQGLFQSKAANTISQERYVKPQFQPKSTASGKYESRLFPDPGEVVMVEGGDFCGKTSICAFCVHENSRNQLVIFIDANDFLAGDMITFLSFLRQTLPKVDRSSQLRDEDLQRLILWMEQHSKDVLFVLDNAPNPSDTSPIGSINDEVPATAIIANLMNKDRLIFQNSSVLFTCSSDTKPDKRCYSRAFVIEGFHDHQREIVIETHCEEKPQIPKRIEYLCVNPGFCVTILRQMKQRTNLSFLGDWLSLLLSELVRQYPSDQQQPKINSIVRGIHIAQTYDNGENESCSSLESEYRMVLNCAYIMKKEDFKSQFKRSSNPPSLHSRKWRTIAGLLCRGDTTGNWFPPLLQTMKKEAKGEREMRAKQDIMLKYIESKKSEIKELRMNNTALANEWEKYAASLKKFGRR